ncbi:LysR substrate-binding domain-containing protein [Nitratireductor sp. ZSWI3]|uniref:LysR substrate-binding domain-containing protein n=1 Tax=Nitratireductor sp. ZSWI3 TaxID=2966359 RepID=UPI00215009D4|nr:LysR substrate-binding domain-containing protein [Nitratireductor sp. ZSWI3]MCR4268001.1 LysR substrate-binding domain-containing protein [Nitratireductor sp. ZSWI3]
MVADKFARRFLPSFSVLRSFASAARHQSFTLAAEELNLTQSAVSRHIRDMEAALGFSLFRRVGRRVVLTPAGKSLADALEDDLGRITQTLHRAIAAGMQGTTLNVASLPTFASRWLIPRLPHFESTHPGIGINLTARINPFDLAHERFDVAIHFGRENWPDAKLTKLCDEAMIAVASPRFIEEHCITGPETLLDVPLLHLQSRPGVWIDWMREAGVEEGSVLPGKQFDQFTMVIAGAAAGLGAGLVPAYLIEEELRSGALRQVGQTKLKTPNSYFLVQPLGVDNPSADAFVAWMVQQV